MVDGDPEAKAVFENRLTGGWIKVALSPNKIPVPNCEVAMYCGKQIVPPVDCDFKGIIFQDKLQLEHS